MDDITRKQLILIDFLKQYANTNDWKFKAEYSTNDNDTKVVVVQEQTGQKQVLFNGEKIYNYYQIQIFGESIQEQKNLSLLMNDLIGTNNYIEKTVNGKKETWQILIKQFSNFQPIEYYDIRRVGYSGIMLCIINKIKEEDLT